MGAPSPAAADTTLVVGKAKSEAESIMTVNVGDDAGIFKKHGLDLQIQDFSGGGSRIVQALTASSIDIAIGAGTQMSFVAKGAPMIAVCESTTTLPYFSIGLPWDSPIQTVDELKGKKIGVSNPGTLTDWVAMELSRKKGWGPDGVMRVSVGGGIAASSAAFRAGQIDAYVGGTASFLVEADRKVGRMLIPVSEFVGKIGLGHDLCLESPDPDQSGCVARLPRRLDRDDEFHPREQGGDDQKLGQSDRDFRKASSRISMRS